MKIKVLNTTRRQPLESRSLIIAEDYITNEGFSIAEKCYPGVWVTMNIDIVEAELIPVSHPYLSDAKQADSHDVSNIYSYVGGRKGAEQLLQKFIEEAKQKGIEFVREGN